MDLLESNEESTEYEVDIGYEGKENELAADNAAEGDENKDDDAVEGGGADGEEDEDEDDDAGPVAPDANMENKQKHAVKIIHIVPQDERKTSNVGTMFELAHMLGSRCAHIINGAPVFVDTTGLSTVGIILKEASEGKIPMGIFRTTRETATDKWVEMWTFAELGWDRIPLKDPVHSTLKV